MQRRATRVGTGGLIENRREVDALGLPVIAWPARASSRSTRPTISSKVRKPSSRHVFAHLLGDEEEEVDDVLRLPGKALAQHRVLRGDAHRAGIEVALAHHDAAHGDQRRGGKAELLGAQQRGDGHVAPGLQLAVGLHANAAAQIVQQQHLLRFRQAKFPGNAGVLDGTERRCAGAAAVAADQHHIRMRFGHARGHRAHAHFRHQLHARCAPRVDVLQIVDQLRQIFDRINVVVRRRRDQAHAGNRVAHARDHLVHFVAGQAARPRRAWRPAPS